MRFQTSSAAALSLLWAGSSADLSETASDKAWAMVARMNFTEKVAMLHGHNGVYVGNIVGNERLGIPSINMQDGPQGFRVTTTTGAIGSTTAWPSALSVAASWDRDVAYRWAAAMGQEFKMKGANVQLGPGIGLARVPTGGRNFEYLCGEDPYLGSRLAEDVVRGIQDQGIIANAKHWVNNEIEEQRMTVSANIDERTRFEIYYPPFEAAVNAGVLSVMCAYNRVNDLYACQNPETLNGHLKTTMKFEGWVMSDWTATHSTAAALNAGLDQELPVGVHFNEESITKAIDDGSLAEETIDQSVHRMLTSMYAIGLFHHEPIGDPLANVTSAEHNALTREIAAKASVLLKNDAGQLPIKLEDGNIRQIAVIGDESIVGGDGSGRVTPGYVVTPTQGITNAVREAGFEGSVNVVYLDGKDINAASALAADSDLVIVLVATTSGEGNDRETLSLGSDQDALVAAALSVNPTGTVVAVTTPGACLMPWASEAHAILVSWLPGQEAGNALADVLFGIVNPSGRLTVTIPNMDNEIGFTPAQYPGVGHPPEAAYDEGLLVGYRYYEAKNIDPVFPFGHGLSYSSFEYSDLSWTTTSQDNGKIGTLTFNVANTGALDGSEVSQLYITFPASLGEPPNQLKGFEKVMIKSGASSPISFEVSTRDVSTYDATIHDWVINSGTYVAKIGSSSRNLPLEISFTI